ncbi:Hypothetical protein CINCED_3A001207 [Cinara cedri]|uniref:Uncharacterized protein n=1 Tax=Cinara cedri TaxID=506608 RepID=A0A5E4N7V5_9HEMI|nr:Hypothetical protein CINCED_3A001207 [Cinara cedri]
MLCNPYGKLRTSVINITARNRRWGDAMTRRHRRRRCRCSDTAPRRPRYRHFVSSRRFEWQATGQRACQWTDEKQKKQKHIRNKRLLRLVVVEPRGKRTAAPAGDAGVYRPGLCRPKLTRGGRRYRSTRPLLPRYCLVVRDEILRFVSRTGFGHAGPPVGISKQFRNICALPPTAVRYAPPAMCPQPVENTVDYRNARFRRRLRRRPGPAIDDLYARKLYPRRAVAVGQKETRDRPEN